ncbi:MAG: carbonic anhydrase [Elusimicrobiota bacterium]
MLYIIIMMDARGTCLNCMDGRVQLPVLRWIKDNYPVDFVDVITEAGMDGILSDQKDIAGVLRSIAISVDVNKSSMLFVVGHYDCRGNAVDEAAHHRQINNAVKRLKGHWPGHGITGLWVNEAWRVAVVSDGK